MLHRADSKDVGREQAGDDGGNEPDFVKDPKDKEASRKRMVIHQEHHATEVKEPNAEENHPKEDGSAKKGDGIPEFSMEDG